MCSMSGQQLLPVLFDHDCAMTPELAQVMPGRGMAAQPTPALFQIEQGHLHPRRIAFTMDLQEDVLGITAPMLPVRLMDAREGHPDRREHARLDRRTEALFQIL